MTIPEYLANINALYKSGRATEHSYRGDLTQLLQSMVTGVEVTNEPKRIDCGAPDYIISKGTIPIGYIEAKDIGVSLDATEKSEQLKRYLASLNNLILTDYVEFRLFRNGVKVKTISLAHIEDGKIKANSSSFGEFTDLIKDVCLYISQTITSAEKLAKMMAGKARMLESVFEKALTADVEDTLNPVTALQQQYLAFKDVLLHDLSIKEFADLYSQTIAYGMFAARLHDKTLNDFSRHEAAQLIPTSNPLLRKLFQYIAGYDLDERISWIVDALADIFLHTDVKETLKSFKVSSGKEDPMIHFYETFLAEYDPKLRKSRGVFYTPEPVVNFIVRAVDDILKTEFDLPQGLADTSKTKIKLKSYTKATADGRSKAKQVEREVEVHKVQILDPATGTGTFLAEVVKQIYSRFEGQQGIWSNYVENHLIPRLNGFEILMASYAMAHLKLDLLLTETGYKPQKEQRYKVYLTNSLEEHHPDTGTLFSGWLSSEANEANHIKRDTPVMCVIGNPPYSGISANKGEWISRLIEDYKYIDGVHFNERKHWLNDDYVKFIRYSQHYIEKNGSGVLAFINPHGFLENPTFRGMRWNLLKTYDKIYTIDLHGNSNKKEVCPDGSPDFNVFDIQQGVSINIFIKTNSKKANDLAKVFTYDLYGKQESKYQFLNLKQLGEIEWLEVEPKKNNYSFKKVDTSKNDIYQNGFKLTELYNIWTTGVQTSRDKIALSFTSSEAKLKSSDFCSEEINTDELRSKYFSQTSPKYSPGDTRDWKLETQRAKSSKDELNSSITNYCFRPFDNRKIIFHDNIISWSRMEVSQHLLKDNVSLITARSNKKGIDHFFISKSISDVKCGERTTGSIFCPLYIFNSGQTSLDQSSKRNPNFNQVIVDEIAKNTGLTYTNEKEKTENTFAPIDILDYIYAVLHSPTYRETYKEFLKIDFPRVPYPEKENFWQLVELGGQIRQLHLLDTPKVDQFITSYPESGDSIITRRIGKNDWDIIDNEKQIGRVWINDQQYFDKVPEIAWNFYIGGYQPAQKWLKDRKGRELSFNDIMHYQKIIVALAETDRLMKEIDKVIKF